MATTDDRLRAVLDAAQRLLAARDDGMVTVAEWDALQDAVEDCSEYQREDQTRGDSSRAR